MSAADVRRLHRQRPERENAEGATMRAWYRGETTPEQDAALLAAGCIHLNRYTARAGVTSYLATTKGQRLIATDQAPRGGDGPVSGPRREADTSALAAPSPIEAAAGSSPLPLSGGRGGGGSPTPTFQRGRPMRYDVTVHIEVEAESHEAARDLVYREIDSRPAVGPDNPFWNVDVADVYEVDSITE
jgi:hypothetical protein